MGLIWKLDVNGQDPSGDWTGLHIAIYHKNIRIVKLLVNGGANLELRCFQLETPLYLALADGNLKSLNSWFHLAPMSIHWPLTTILSFILCRGCWKVRFCQNYFTKWCIAYCRNQQRKTLFEIAMSNKKLSSMKLMMFH